MKSKGKKKVVINKEENSENWCFVCKDGGEIRICDHKQCLKSYHPRCLDKDDSFLTSENRWTCAWHNCFLCNRSSYFHCYTCPKAFCRRCLPSANFLQVKRQNGFCTHCLKLALLIEENKNCDSDGEKVDFTDRETCEGLFMEYYMIIKDAEGFESGDIYTAKNRLKMKKNNQYGSGLEEYEEYHVEEEDEDEDEVSDYDDVVYDKKRKRNHKEKKSDRKKCAIQTPLKSNKKEFIGWGSRSLIEFLDSIGKSSNEKLSQHDVTSIVNNYVKENNLFRQGKKKKMIECDERLRSLFGKFFFSRNRVYELLEVHFAENHDESEEEEEEEFGYDSEDDSKGILGAYKKQRRMDHSEKKSQKKELESNVDQSCFAAIVIENIKLVYLKRSLLQELLNKRENFEEKVIGCFVRVKSDPYDYRSRNSHQLLQVKGVKTVSNSENNSETVLLFTSMPKEIKTSLLSDDYFSEEECEDLRQKMLAGLLERPTVGDLQQKANTLHEDLTKHWIAKQLVLLPKLIDRANEKGWRYERFKYLDMQKKLQTPEEESRLLKIVPKVTPDLSQLDPNPGDIINDMKIDEGSPKSILPRNSSVPSDVWQDNITPEDKACDDHASSPPESKLSISDKSTPELMHDTITYEEKTDKLETVAQESILCSREVIELLSDDENGSDSKGSSVLENGKLEEMESETWCIKGPCGEENKSSLLVMKKWIERSPYAAKFKAWKEDESEEDAIWLKDAISIAFPKM